MALTRLEWLGGDRFVIGSLIVSATVILKHLMNYGNEKFKVSLPFHKKHEESEGAAQESKQE